VIAADLISTDTNLIAGIKKKKKKKIENVREGN